MKKILFAMLMLQISGFALIAQQEARLMRFPAIHGDKVVFSYAGDLYTVGKAGGIARRLTNDEGNEMFPRFSPDGKTIAFTGQYDGNTEVFSIPADGGVPVRLTYTATLKRDDLSDRMGPNNLVMTWKDDNTIVFRSRKKTFNDFIGHLFEVSKDGGLPVQIELPAGGFCSFSPDGKKLAHNQVFREFRTWKYYKGGMADDVWVYNFETKQTENVTNNDAQDIFPMWHDDFIYFLSDRDRTMNLFAYNINTRETRKLTNFTEYDIKFPSLGDNAIIFENGGYLYYFDLVTQRPVKIEIQIMNDFNASRPQWKDADKTIRSASLSYDGNRIAFGSRGEIFSVPVKSGVIRNLTNTNIEHDRNLSWSPDGNWIAYISDKTGEDEIFVIKPDGTEKPVQLTTNADTYKFSLRWSPDSKKIAWHDQMKRLQFIDIETKSTTVIATSTAGEINDYDWSTDSKWLAYELPDTDVVSRIYLYNLDNKTSEPVTDLWFNASSPSFSTDGKYLYFTSMRTFNPIYSWTEWNHAYQDMVKVYLLTLEKETPSPFERKNDQAAVKKPEGAAEEKKEEKKPGPEAKNIKVDFDGIFDRVIEVTTEAGAYWNLTGVDGGVYYNRMKSGDNGSKFLYFKLEDKKETELGSNMSYTLSGDGKKMLIAANGKYAVIDLPRSPIKLDEYVDVSNMKVWIDPKLEWQQIYNESWRQMKHFFYAPNMHGVDWDKMYNKYNVLVPYVNSRYDLTYVIGEMIGELNVGHAYVNEGDRVLPKRIQTGLLGAELSRDESGYFRIDKILKGENWNKEARSPLAEVGLDIKAGDFIVAVNGMSTKDMDNIYRALVGTAGKMVEISVNSTAAEAGARPVIVEPIADESELYYYEWVQGNIEKVEKATNGQVGYIHIPDMGPAGLNQFVKYFYPQIRKKALIIDDRGNGGGNVSPMIIERLRRELSMMASGRNTEGNSKPNAMMAGPMVCLINRYSASDGDLFPYQFRKHNLGPLIGTRTWGGVVGIRGSLPFIDGGDLRKPEFAHYSADGNEWIIEGYGVEPDIEVWNDPALEFAGTDQQLNKAIEVILGMLKDEPDPQYPPPPPFPDKSK
ncbi:MAG: PD40 domain-containing protein [Bacteroidales bacterium]|nr:PD40 domain-containing protein [Bacteroidales bacterium]